MACTNRRKEEIISTPRFVCLTRFVPSSVSLYQGSAGGEESEAGDKMKQGCDVFTFTSDYFKLLVSVQENE